MSHTHKNADGATGSIKEQPISLDLDVPAEAEPETEDIHGAGALDNPSNAEPNDVGGEDTEKTGVKDPDAMGAGA